MSVVSINVMSFLVVCRKPFANRVGVGTQSTFEEVVLALWLRPDIVMFDAVVSGYPLPSTYCSMPTLIPVLPNPTPLGTPRGHTQQWKQAAHPPAASWRPAGQMDVPLAAWPH